MKKRFLAHINLLLGAASLGLIGCHSSQKASQPVQSGHLDEPRKYGPPLEMITTPEEPPIEQPAPAPIKDEPIVCKYGVPLMMMLCIGLLTACQPKVQDAKVYGRYVPERKGDFAWENEYAAWRMYGAPLKAENPSNGVDLWLKNSPALVIDTMYGRELKDHRPYHINYDGNLDCYKVGHTCGAGGLVVMADDKTYIGGPFDRWQILEQTPDKFVFRLEYDSFLVAGHILQESITITAMTGEPMNKAEVVLTSKELSAFPIELLAGGGIYMHDTIDHFEVYEDLGTIYYEEDALSDKQAAQMNYDYNGSTSQGRIFLTVRTPDATVTDMQDGNLIAVKPYQLGDTLTYYFGATWSEWRE